MTPEYEPTHRSVRDHSAVMLLATDVSGYYVLMNEAGDVWTDDDLFEDRWEPIPEPENDANLGLAEVVARLITRIEGIESALRSEGYRL